MTRLYRTALIALIALSAPAASHPAENLTFDSARTQIVFAEGRERAILSGSARVVTDTTTITAAEIELYGTDYRYALCRGGVKVLDTENDFTLTSDRLFLDRDTNVTRAEGNAVMENRKDQLIIKGSFIENRDDEGVTIIQIGVRILKEDMVARAEFARYLEEEKLLELSGMPQVYWKGDEYRATRIIINIETDEIELQGEVSGSMKNEKKDRTAAPADGQEAEPDSPENAEPVPETEAPAETEVPAGE